MAEIKWEHVDNQHIRKWEKGNSLYKTDLLNEKALLQSILGYAQNSVEKMMALLGMNYTFEKFQEKIQERLDYITYVQEMINDPYTPETINFVDES
jgi:hypothetical protein